ncbi:3-hydroxyacyl-CoA dehydrogenase family protein [Amycolatopsis sp. lyj-112]|uniref:3-hydroxyacyl-CoA dehydrogenase family protein n=1 Tax=Amycolatopsis sp. lyj-112 TaxID=2789288 RepID=UPI00397B2BDB
MTIVGVAGAGVMGTGVAQNLAQTGHQVILTDISPAALDAALTKIRQNCRFSGLTGGPRVDVGEVMSRITVSVGVSGLAEADVVIENITENWDEKRAFYVELGRTCKPETIFVVNTSAIPITKVAGVTDRADRVVGVHFMNPVPMKPAVELIPGHHTSPETMDRIRDLLGAMGKKALAVNDACGFVSNRVLMLTVNEAAFLVHEGTAPAATVDEVFRECFGHPMGPLETADLIGLDTILYSIEVLYEHYADSKYRPCPLLRRLTDAGLLGRKSGEGFYRYETSGGLAPVRADIAAQAAE